MQEQNIHRIPENKLDSFVRRQAIRNIRPALFAFIGFPLLLLVFFPSFDFFKILILPLLIIFLVISALIFIGSLGQISNWAQKMYFLWNDKEISKQVFQGDLNYLNQFAMSRSESRYGSKFNQKILMIHLDSTKITPKEIIFTSYDYNLLTGNGRIRIPHELDSFEELKAHILSNKATYKVTSIVEKKEKQPKEKKQKDSKKSYDTRKKPERSKAINEKKNK